MNPLVLLVLVVLVLLIAGILIILGLRQSRGIDPLEEPSS